MHGDLEYADPGFDKDFGKPQDGKPRIFLEDYGVARNHIPPTVNIEYIPEHNYCSS